MKKTILAGLALLFGMIPQLIGVPAETTQQMPALEPLELEPLAAGIYLASGGGIANCGFVVGEKEVLDSETIYQEQKK